MGKDEDNDDDDEGEPVKPITSPCDSVWVLRIKCQKVSLNRCPLPILHGGLGSHPTPSHVIRKRTVNTTLAKGHQADPAHC
jgi:hypothetical protein